MVHYRRSKIAGGIYFFTVTTNDRRSQLLIEEVELLCWAMKKVKEENLYSVKAIVILPDHIHAIWELPEGDDNYSSRWRKIKSYFSRGLIEKGYPLIKNKHGEYNFWQRRFWEHTLRNEKDFEKHVDYIHYNPVKHGLVKHVSDWKYSSFHRYVRNGLLPMDWARGIHGNDGNFGEEGTLISPSEKHAGLIKATS